MIKYFCFLILSVFANVKSSIIYESDFYDFNSYLTKYNKTYSNSHEYYLRYYNYHTNIEYINHRNSLNLSYQLGINQFTDMSNDEFS